MANQALMKDLRRLIDGDWIRNELSGPIGMLTMLIEDQTANGQTAHEILANDTEARNIVIHPFHTFAERYQKSDSPMAMSREFTFEEYVADDEAKQFISEIEKSLKAVHEYLLRLEQDPRPDSLSVAENFVSTQLHELINLCQENKENDEHDTEQINSEGGHRL